MRSTFLALYLAFDFFPLPNRDRIDMVKELTAPPFKKSKPLRPKRSWDVKSTHPHPPQSQAHENTNNANVASSFSHPKKNREAFRSSLVNIIM